MGFGLGAAIGAAFARPGSTVINITGDGGFRMNLTELATVCENKLPVITVVVDNGSLGMIKHWQKRYLGERYMESEFADNVDYTTIAGGFGISACCTANSEELRAAINVAVKSGLPAVIICKVKN